MGSLWAWTNVVTSICRCVLPLPRGPSCSPCSPARPRPSLAAAGLAAISTVSPFPECHSVERSVGSPVRRASVGNMCRSPPRPHGGLARFLLVLGGVESPARTPVTSSHPQGPRFSRTRTYRRASWLPPVWTLQTEPPQGCAGGVCADPAGEGESQAPRLLTGPLPALGTASR